MKSASTLLQAIRDTEIEYVSFDVFDTLVVRPFLIPTDLFAFMEDDVQQILGSFDLPCFSTYRHMAEMEARAAHRDQEDVTFEQIYERLAEITKISPEQLKRIQELEIAYEMRFCTRREFAKRLWNEAVKAGKQIIVLSDMYLPESVIASILQKNGYCGYKALFVSADVGFTKGSGHLYSFAQQKLQISSGKRILHIGDNLRSDVAAAKKAGWNSYPLYNPKHLFLNKVPGRRISSPLLQCYSTMGGNASTWNADKFLGIRCLLAVVADHVFDDPFAAGKDPFVVPSNVGYYALGMYLFAIANWLIKDCQAEAIDTMCFFARDGQLIKQAFDLLSTLLNTKAKSEYVRLSRTSLFPIMVSRREDFWAAEYILGEPESHTPRTIRKLIKSITRSMSDEEWLSSVAELGFPPDIQFKSPSRFMQFAQCFYERFYDGQARDRYCQYAKEYLEPLFDGKCAVFDVGYKLRAETAVQKLLNKPLSAYYVHCDTDLAIRRGLNFQGKTHALYPFMPFVTWRIREMLLEPDEASCIGYEAGGKPYYDKNNSPSAQSGSITAFQAAGIHFVKDIVRRFGKDIERLAYRTVDACAPFETFLCSSSRREVKPFLRTKVENDFCAINPETHSMWMCLRAEHRAAIACDGKWKRRARIAITLSINSPQAMITRAVKFARKHLR